MCVSEYLCHQTARAYLTPASQVNEELSPTAMDAEFACQSKFADAHLATVETDLDALFLGQILRESTINKLPYIGYMFDTFSQTYRWTAGSTARFSNWAQPPAPSMSTACTITENGLFVAAACNERRPSVCTTPGGK